VRGLAYDPRVELAEVVLYVRDMERAVRFYRDTVGLEPDAQGQSWTMFRPGPCTLALHAAERRDPGIGEPDPTFVVTDAEAERRRLAAAGVEVTEIREPAAGVRVFDLKDPDGNRLSIESRT
jgi:catechol 2,3-dioxygenase-like lactoylglutathione lyase family enzyme